FPVYINTFGAIRGVDQKLVEPAQAFGLGRLGIIRRVILPGALPGFLVGVRWAIGTSWLLLVFAEQVNANNGVGYLITQAQPWNRVLPNVALGLQGGDVKARAQAALEEVGLGDRARSWPVTLSGGEAQRVALARALVREPDLVLLDEPFGALDALTRIRMQRLLRELCERHRPAVVLVTHDVDEAILLADRVLVLVD